MSRVRKWLTALAMCAVTTLVMVVVAPTPARADQIILPGFPAEVSGFLGVHNDVITWDLGLRDENSGSDCVYIKINIDRNNRPDTQYYSRGLCNAGTGEFANFTVNPPQGVTLRGTRGARVYQCYLHIIYGFEVCPHYQDVPEQN